MMGKEYTKPVGEHPFTKKRIILRAYQKSSAIPHEEGSAAAAERRELLNGIVYQKAKREFQAYLSALKARPTPEEIVRGSHEAVIKNYLVEALEYGNLKPNQLQALAELPFPLQSLYDYWEEERDDPLIPEALDCVHEYADSLLQRQKARGAHMRDDREGR